MSLIVSVYKVNRMYVGKKSISCFAQESTNKQPDSECLFMYPKLGGCQWSFIWLNIKLHNSKQEMELSTCD